MGVCVHRYLINFESLLFVLCIELAQCYCAQMAVKAGIVELDYEAVEDCSATVDAPAVISVRGYGKFAVHAFDGVTKKGRVRLVAGKYI